MRTIAHNISTLEERKLRKCPTHRQGRPQATRAAESHRGRNKPGNPATAHERESLSFSLENSNTIGGRQSGRRQLVASFLKLAHTLEDNVTDDGEAPRADFIERVLRSVPVGLKIGIVNQIYCGNTPA